MTRSWLHAVCLALGLAHAVGACSQNDEDKAKAAARTATGKAANAIDRAKAAAGTAKDKLGEAIALGEQGLDSLALRPGILDELDAGIKRATEAVKTAANDAARTAALATLMAATKARAAIAKRIDELQAAGKYTPHLGAQ